MTEKRTRNHTIIPPLFIYFLSWQELHVIHALKTAGMSMTAMLRDHRKGAISLTEPYEASSVQGGIEYIRDKRHETLDDAATFFDERHIWLEQFEQFVVVMRSSYELELSCFAYLLKDLPWDRGKAQELVLEGGFRQHLATALFFGMNPPGLDLYYHVEGHIPDNLVILRYEKLAAEIERHIASYLESSYGVPHQNQSTRARGSGI